MIRIVWLSSASYYIVFKKLWQYLTSRWMKSVINYTIDCDFSSKEYIEKDLSENLLLWKVSDKAINYLATFLTWSLKVFDERLKYISITLSSARGSSCLRTLTTSSALGAPSEMFFLFVMQLNASRNGPSSKLEQNQVYIFCKLVFYQQKLSLLPVKIKSA